MQGRGRPVAPGRLMALVVVAMLGAAHGFGGPVPDTGAAAPAALVRHAAAGRETGPAGRTPFQADIELEASPDAYRIAGSGRSGNSTTSAAIYDGSLETVWTSTESRPRSAYVYVQLGEVKPIAVVRWWFGEEGLAEGLRVEVSNDRETWQTVARPGNGMAGVWHEVRVDARARYVRWYVTNPRGLSRVGGIAEVEVVGPPGRTAPGPPCQPLMIPAYFSYDTGLWEMATALRSAVAFLVVNPNNGVDERPDWGYVRVIDRAQAAGIRVLGYVATDLGDRDLAAVTAEIDRYRAWYGIDGVYFDEVGAGLEELPYYRELARYVQAEGGIAVLSPGWYPESEAYMEFSDIVVLYEDTYDRYLTYQYPAWIDTYPSERFAHMIYGARTGEEMEEALRLARERNARYVWVTDDDRPRPFDSLPPYFVEQALLARTNC